MDFAGGRTCLVQRIGAVHLVEGVQDRVFGFQKCPPHGHRRLAKIVRVGVGDDGPVRGAAQQQLERGRAFDRNAFLAHLQVHPLAPRPDLVAVGRIGLFGNQVQVVVLEHGHAPAKTLVEAEQGQRVQRLEVAIQLEARRGQVRLVPHGRRGIADVRVAGQQRLAAGAAAAGNDPGIAAFQWRHQGVLQQLPAHLGHVVQRAPVGTRQRDPGAGAVHALRMPCEVEHVKVSGAQRVAHKGHGGFGAQRRCKAVGQVARDRHRVLRREGPLGYAQDAEFDRRRVAGLVLVHAVQVGRQRQHGRAGGVQPLHVGVGMRAYAHGAEQPVDIQQFRPQDFGQLAACQPPRHFHLEQAVLGVHVTQGPV